MDAFELSKPLGDPGEASAPAWSAAAVVARALRDPARRRTPPRLRVFFLRHYRQCGEVSLAAKRTGVPLSTLYRWRKNDPAFRERWDGIRAQIRQIAEDRMMAILREGELRSVYYKGLEVGLRRTFTHLASIRTLDYFDRQTAEKMSRNPSRSTAPEPAKNPEESAA